MKRSDEETVLSSATACPSCGTRRLSTGTCPACALIHLLEGGPAADPEGAEIEKHSEQGTEEPVGGRYVLKEQKSGGMGVVYVAEDKKLGRTVALKMIRGTSFADEGERARFTIETEAAAGLNHPNIVPIYEVGELDGQPFFTMMLVDGGSLAERLRKLGKEDQRMPAREVAGLLGGIARAVQYAHQQGVLHRDLKPGNILIDGVGTPWLTDFGLAKLTQSESGVTLTTDALGTPDYMSPEVAGGNVKEASTASDVWALGVILWEMLFGAPPFRGAGAVETMRRIVESEPEKLRGIRADEDLVTLAVRCMEKDPGRRLNSAGELADELERWGRGEPIHARRITGGEWLWKWVRRNPTLTALYAAVALGGVASFALWQKAESAVVSLTESKVNLERTLDLAQAMRLAGDARLQVEENPIRALLLAVEAVEAGERSTGSVLPEAYDSLFSVLRKVGGTDTSAMGMRATREFDGFIASLGDDQLAYLSPDGELLLTVDNTEWKEHGVMAALFATDPSMGEALGKWKLYDEPGYHHRFLWIPDSKNLLTLDPEGNIQIIGPLDVWVEGGCVGVPDRRSVGNIYREGMEIVHLRNGRRQDGTIGFWVMYAEKNELREIDPKSAAEAESYLCWLGFREDSEWKPGQEAPLLRLPHGYATMSGAVISPDGSWLLLCGGGRDVELILADLNVDPGENVLPTVTLPDGRTSIERAIFSDDGRWLAFRDLNKEVNRLYDIGGGLEGAASSGRDIFPGYGDTHSLNFSKDSEMLAVAGDRDLVQVIRLGGAGRGDSPKSVRLSGGPGNVARFSDDGKWLAAAGLDRVVTVWEVAELGNAPESIEFRGLTTPVMDVRFSPDGETVIASGLHGTHRRWPVERHSPGALPKVLPGRGNGIADLAVSPDRRWIASACLREGQVKWTAVDGSGELVLGNHAKHATGVAFSPDGKWFASTGKDGMAKVWSIERVAGAIESGDEAPGADFEFDMGGTRLQYERKVAFHPRGTLYCTCGDGLLFDWDLNAADPYASAHYQRVHSIGYLLPDVAVSPDGNTMAICRHGWDNKPSEGYTQYGNMVLLFDVSQPGMPVPITEFLANFLGDANVEFSADNRWLAAGAAGMGALVWDLHASDIGASRIESPVKSHRLHGLSFSPDGSRLALGGSDGRLHLWDWREGGKVRTFSAGESVSTLAWLDENRFVCGGDRGRVSVWMTEVNALKELARETAGRELSDAEVERFQIIR